MKISSLRATSLLTLAAFAISGCASTSDGRLTQAQGTGAGVVLGGLLGGGITALQGGSGESIARNAAIGGAAGGVAGFAYGSMVAKRKQEYANAEAWLDQEIVIAKKANARAVAYNNSLKTRLAALEKRAAAAKAAQNQAELKSVKAEIIHIESDEARQAKTEAQTKKDYADVSGDKTAKASPNYSQYRSASQEWNSAQSERTTLINRTASLRSSIDG